MGLSYETLCVAVRRLMKAEGRFSLVLPFVESLDFLEVATGYRLFLHKRMTIIPIEGKAPNRVNLELAFSETDSVQEETFTIRDRNKRFTAQYNEFLKDFYLGL